MIGKPTLGDRIRGIVAPPAATSQTPVPRVLGPGTSEGPHSLEAVLGGAWQERGGARAFVVEWSHAASSSCGRGCVGELAEALQRSGSQAPLLAGGGPARPPFVFFDLETTGLSGGAGTHVFLIGCGRFNEHGDFVTVQHLLSSFADERPMLQAAAQELASAGVLVSFNGKSFDAPVLETRYLFHRLRWAGQDVPHVDVLHPARRFWRQDAAEPSASCSLTTLERTVLGAGRTDDVAGFEIPSRFFQFVRSGDARPLAAVLWHNRRDLLSLAALTARLLHLIDSGPAATGVAQEALALGKLYERAGLDGRAVAAFERALTLSWQAGTRPTLIALEACRALAVAARRAGRHDEAALRWQQVLEGTGCPARLAREALEALAIHHEHRARDLGLARAYALRSLDGGARPSWDGAVRHRLARLERKMAGAQGARLELID